MRQLHDTLTRGPFRDDTHRAAVEAAAVDLAPGQLRGNSPHVLGSPEKPDDGVSGGLATQTHAGASEASQRAPQAPRVFTIQTSTANDPIGAYISFIEDEGDVALHGVCRIYDAATRALASAGPLPLASTEPWVEPDDSYIERFAMGRAPGENEIFWHRWMRHESIDAIGSSLGLPRARLVPADSAMRDVKEGM